MNTQVRPLPPPTSSTMPGDPMPTRRLPRGLILAAAALLIPGASLLAQEGADAVSAEATTAAPLEEPASEAADAAASAEAPAPSTPTARPLPAEKSARAIHGLLLDIAYTGQRLVAVGERGNIVASRDGERWAQVAVPVRATLTGLSFADANEGWAVGHDTTILHTADGGRTWTVQNYQPERLRPLHDAFFLDTQRGYAFGAFGTFLQTQDGGRSWSDVDAPAVLEEGYHLNGMTRLNDGQLMIVGESGLLGVSADGSTWDRLESPYEGSYFGVVPRGDKGALVYGLRGNVYVSDDVRAGDWRKVDLSTVSSIFGGVPMEDGSVVLVGADAVVLTVRADDTVERRAAHAGPAGSSTISSVARWPGGLMTVGESGVQPYALTGAAPAAAQEMRNTGEFN